MLLDLWWILVTNLFYIMPGAGPLAMSPGHRPATSPGHRIAWQPRRPRHQATLLWMFPTFFLNFETCFCVSVHVTLTCHVSRPHWATLAAPPRQPATWGHITGHVPRHSATARHVTGRAPHHPTARITSSPPNSPLHQGDAPTPCGPRTRPAPCLARKRSSWAASPACCC